MVTSMVNIQHQIVTHKLQTKHSKGVTVDCFFLLEHLAISFAISNPLLCARQVKVACTTVVTKFIDNSNPYCNARTALLTQDFTVNCGAVLRSQAAQVLLSLSGKYNYSHYGLCDRISATTFKGPWRYTIFMGSSVNRSNQRAYLLDKKGSAYKV